jgi:exopolyphosphatase / guanosine-5'-triphosphate,3'-diphosphate pyrophosphatase
VVDIGSNSVRLVIYDRLWRSPVQQFNEKLLGGLGRSLATTGRLGGQAMALVLANLVRFARLAEAMHVEDVDMLATEAVRAAANGREFVREIERRTGHQVTVITGEQEARLAAQGVLAGSPEARGVMGDLGGASLEVAELDDGGVGRLASLPLGPLRLADLSGGGPARAEIDRHLQAVDWLGGAADRELHLVGGSWRALARLHMAETRYPLHVIQGYALERDAALALVQSVARLGRRGLAERAGVSRKRIETLPLAALVLERLIAHARPARIVFSAYGLREGRLFSRLPPEERAIDPLLATAAELGLEDRRFDALGEALAAWLEPLYRGEEGAARRLRLAACHLADIAWREHPDYRAIQALRRLLLLPAAGLGHQDRAFLAAVVYTRYEGNPADKEAAAAFKLLPKERRVAAEVLGRALRLAYTLSGGTTAILGRSRLVLDGDRLLLALPDDGSVPHGDAVERRLRALAKTLQGGRRHAARIRYSMALAEA